MVKYWELVYPAEPDSHPGDVLKRLQAGATTDSPGSVRGLDLARAISQNKLTLHYQPMVCLRSGRVISAEALVRWHHPVRGLLTAEHFVPLAEETGLIGPLTRWVLSTALQHCRLWRQAGWMLTVAVNISALDLSDDRLPDAIVDLAARWGVSLACLTLELTETRAMPAAARSSGVLNRLRSLGLQLSIDDFGAGYSSLATLVQVPASQLKIDQSLIRALAHESKALALTRWIVRLGRELGISIVAEGVEDERAWEHLLGLGCDVAQGYYLSPPLSIARLLDWLSAPPLAIERPHLQRHPVSSAGGSP